VAERLVGHMSHGLLDLLGDAFQYEKLELKEGELGDILEYVCETMVDAIESWLKAPEREVAKR